MSKLGLTLAILASFAATAAAAEKAWYGFHIKPHTTGFVLNPVVQSVVIDMIAPNSPASAQGIRVGDEILEADGTTVPGTHAVQLITLVNKKPGDTLRLLLRRRDGETYRVVIVATKKPVK